MTGAGSGGAFAFIGQLLGYADGGYTGQGGKYQPAGIVHAGEFVLSKSAVDRIGIGPLEDLQNRALRGYSSGGLVGPKNIASAVSGRPMASAAPSVTINSPVTVNASGGSPEQNADLAEQTARAVESSMRRVASEEIRRAMRPGKMLRK